MPVSIPGKGIGFTVHGLGTLGLPGMDPFSAVYAALWASLGENPIIAGLVPPSNRGRWDEGRDPEKQNKQDANYPWLEIRPSGGAWQAETSDHMRVVQAFEFVTMGADFRLARFYFPLKFGLLTWFRDRQKDERPGFGLMLPFVSDVRLIAGFEDRRPAEGTSTSIWYHLLTIEVEMMIDLDGLSEGVAR